MLVAELVTAVCALAECPPRARRKKLEDTAREVNSFIIIKKVSAPINVKRKLARPLTKQLPSKHLMTNLLEPLLKDKRGEPKLRLFTKLIVPLPRCNMIGESGPKTRQMPNVNVNFKLSILLISCTIALQPGLLDA